MLHTVELPKLGPIGDDVATRHDPLVVLARFLMAETDDERRAIAEESPAVKQAVDLLTQLSSDEADRRRSAPGGSRRHVGAERGRGDHPR